MPLYTEPSSLFLGFLLSAGLNLMTLLLLHAGITGVNHTFHLNLTLVISQALWFILPYTMDNLAFPPPSESQFSFPRLLRIARVCECAHLDGIQVCRGTHRDRILFSTSGFVALGEGPALTTSAHSGILPPG